MGAYCEDEEAVPASDLSETGAKVLQGLTRLCEALGWLGADLDLVLEQFAFDSFKSGLSGFVESLDRTPRNHSYPRAGEEHFFLNAEPELMSHRIPPRSWCKA